MGIPGSIPGGLPYARFVPVYPMSASSESGNRLTVWVSRCRSSTIDCVGEFPGDQHEYAMRTYRAAALDREAADVPPLMNNFPSLRPERGHNNITWAITRFALLCVVRLRRLSPLSRLSAGLGRSTHCRSGALFDVVLNSRQGVQEGVVCCLRDG